MPSTFRIGLPIESSFSPLITPSLLRPDIAHQMPIKRLAPDGHLQLVKRVLHHIIGVELVNLPHDQIHVRLMRFREEQELGAAEGLEAGESEEGRLEHFQPRALQGGGSERGRRERFCYRVDAGGGGNGINIGVQ